VTAGHASRWPERTCIGCRRKADARLLVRFVAPEGRLIPGAGRAGRGAWLCAETTLACFDLATQRRRWGAALRVRVDPASVAELRNQLLVVSAPELR
jgi:predicted RNA-binding protein YlxR (DUF448 family)